MASKGQKFNKYSEEFKLEIMNKYKNGEGTKNSLAKEYGISKNTVNTWITKINKGKDISINNNYLKGRRKDEITDYKEKYEILKKYQAFLKAQRERK